MFITTFNRPNVIAMFKLNNVKVSVKKMCGSGSLDVDNFDLDRSSRDETFALRRFETSRLLVHRSVWDDEPLYKNKLLLDTYIIN